MNFLNKMERKFGRYAIHGLMRYIVMINIAGAFIGIVNANVYFQFFSLDYSKIFAGQIWRLVTFVFYPGIISGGAMLSPMSLLFFAISVYVYYRIGTSLEQAWGAFWFNMYYFSGILLTALAGLIAYATMGVTADYGLIFINQAMFLAFAVLFPDVQFLLFFVIPVKVKWLGILYGAMTGYEVLAMLVNGSYAKALFIVVGIANFLVFFLAVRHRRKLSPQQKKRRTAYQREVRLNTGITRHKCAICGRSEEDDPTLEFRFCSKCEGNYEYCMEHLFSHTHVKR